MSGWSDGAAYTALVISAVALVLNYRTQRQSIDHQSRLVAIEQDRDAERKQKERSASIVAQERSANPFLWAIVLTNTGLAEARNIRVTLDDRPIEDWPSHNPHPLLVLAAQADYEYLLSKPPMNQPYPRLVKVEWTDDSGRPGQFESTISITRMTL